MAARISSRLASSRAWVDPETLPDYRDPSQIAGNVPVNVKRLVLNTYGSYGVGHQHSFAYAVGQRLHITDLNVHTIGRSTQVVAVAELQVCNDMLNGAGTVHGGCICYLIDKRVPPIACASIPLVSLGLLQGINGVGVTQAVNVFFHAPASIETCMRIVSTSIALGSRIMTSRCEITDKQSGRMLASAILSKMQPTGAPPARL
ncbi:hypothetical protein BD414DRAFT_469372 [Trametes punicea]|nr:hypothetical protein BD414DRAFT_469372 [Trametes punicea]